MNVNISSDFHFGHKVIVPKYRSYASVHEHDMLLLDKIANLRRNDILYVLGDFIFDCPNYEWYMSNIAKMPIRIKLILGNHDSTRIYNNADRAPNIELQSPLLDYKHMWLTHCPIHPQEIRNRLGVVHGHLHRESLDDPRYFNVNLDQNNMEFVPLEVIKQHFKNNVHSSAADPKQHQEAAATT